MRILDGSIKIDFIPDPSLLAKAKKWLWSDKVHHSGCFNALLAKFDARSTPDAAFF